MCRDAAYSVLYAMKYAIVVLCFVLFVFRIFMFRKVITLNPDFAFMHDDDKFEYLFRTDNERTLAW